MKPESVRLGLCLEGGGAKGAYAYGCMLALNYAVVNFHAVAGTSVGALNAALWATGQLTMGQSVWIELRRDRIFADRYPKII